MKILLHFIVDFEHFFFNRCIVDSIQKFTLRFIHNNTKGSNYPREKPPFTRRPTPDQKKSTSLGRSKIGFRIIQKKQRPSYAVIYFEARLKKLLCTNAEQ